MPTDDAQSLLWWHEPGPQVEPNPRDRRGWHLHYLRITREMATMSKCASRQIGAIIVRDNRLVAGGYNGAPPGVDLCQNVDEQCPRRALDVPSGERLDICPAVHAEVNAIATAARTGISVEGATMYAYCTVPCTTCTGAIIAAGISQVVCLEEAIYHPLSMTLFEHAAVDVTRYRREEVDAYHAD